MAIENYCIECKQIARDDCEDRGHVVGTLGQPAPEADEWRVVPYSGEQVEIVYGKEVHVAFCAAGKGGRQHAEQIVRDHRLTGLLPELVDATTDLLNQFYPHRCKVEAGTCRKCDALRNATRTLNAVAKERER